MEWFDCLSCVLGDWWFGWCWLKWVCLEVGMDCMFDGMGWVWLGDYSGWFFGCVED